MENQVNLLAQGQIIVIHKNYKFKNIKSYNSLWDPLYSQYDNAEHTSVISQNRTNSHKLYWTFLQTFLYLPHFSALQPTGFLTLFNWYDLNFPLNQKSRSCQLKHKFTKKYNSDNSSMKYVSSGQTIPPLMSMTN